MPPPTQSTLPRRWYTTARHAHTTAAPASTLLLATLVTLLLAAFARLATADTPPTIHISDRAHPDRTIQIAVQAPSHEAIQAWLPGLTPTRSHLIYDPRTGYHQTTLPLPLHAPTTGWCTVRLIFADHTEHDHRVALDPHPET